MNRGSLKGRTVLHLTLCFLLAVAPAAAAGEDLTQAIRDFGVTDLPVRSVRSLDMTDFNTRVKQAAGQGQAWPKEAVLVALQFVGTGLKGHTTVIEIRTPPEGRQTAMITVSAAGYLDDATAGERWRLWLTQDQEGVWMISRGLWAHLCARPGQTFYTAEPCP